MNTNIKGNFQICIKLPLTVSGCYNTNVRFFTYLNNKNIITCFENIELDGLWENKKLLDGNQRIDWIKSIH